MQALNVVFYFRKPQNLSNEDIFVDSFKNEKFKTNPAAVAASLDKLKVEKLEKEYPVLVFENKTSTEHLLIHLTTHLTYHLGQINYHSRLLDLE